MEQDFQTSFIPKKPMIDDRTVAPRPVSLLTIVAIFLLFTMLLVTGGLYLYRSSLSKNITQMENDLNLAKNRFEPDKIAQLQLLDKRLKSSTEVLNQHVAITPIFQALQAVTMKTVRFSKFAYKYGTTTSSKITVNMSGQAVGYRSIALQSDLFNQDKYNKYFIDPVFSNLSLDDKGNVLFDLTFSVDPTFIDYEQALKTGNTQVMNSPIDTFTIPSSGLPPLGGAPAMPGGVTTN